LEDNMNQARTLGVIGAGQIGTALARRLVPQGWQVMLSFGRDPAALAATAKALGALSGTPAEAVAFGDVVALAVPWQAVREALEQAGSLDGKVLWDCTNALKPDFSGLAIGTHTSAAEEIQRLAPGARVVKGIPPFAQLLHADNPLLNGRAAVSFLCGDDADAKAQVRPLLEALPAAVVDAGPLESARYIEPAGFLLVRLAYGQQLGPRIGLELLRD
jgi:8-hydroxy-5-deazaflavin:NADPH oxidoreductase